MFDDIDILAYDNICYRKIIYDIYDIYYFIKLLSYSLC